MLTAARLPEAFWAEASRQFCLISNILPWKKNNEYSVDSYQRLHGRPFTYHLLRIWGCKCFVYDQQKDHSNLAPRALRGIYVGMAHDQITAQSWSHRIYVPTQSRFINSGQVHFLEDVQRTPETILPPSYHIDKEKDEFDVNKKLRGVVHLDPEDGIFYVIRKVFERNGLALVERLPWPESINSRLEVVHLRDVLEMLRLNLAAEEAGADIHESGEAAQGFRGTPLPSNPSQVSASNAPKPEFRTSASTRPLLQTLLRETVQTFILIQVVSATIVNQSRVGTTIQLEIESMDLQRGVSPLVKWMVLKYWTNHREGDLQD